MNTRLLRTLALASCLCTLANTAHSQELNTLKENTERWIEIRSRLAKEKNDWGVENQVLKSGIETLESSRGVLEADVEFHQKKSEEIDTQTNAAKEKFASFEKTNNLLLSQVVEYESKLLNLSKRLPSPLLDSINQLLAKIPTPDAVTETPLPNRLQNVVAIMTIIDEFNNELHMTHTIKELDNGEVIEVRILYWGLAAGYATNNLGTRAWTLIPEKDSWTWSPAGDDALAIKSLFDVYDKTIEPTLIDVPFSFSGKEESQ